MEKRQKKQKEEKRREGRGKRDGGRTLGARPGPGSLKGCDSTAQGGAKRSPGYKHPYKNQPFYE